MPRCQLNVVSPIDGENYAPRCCLQRLSHHDDGNTAQGAVFKSSHHDEGNTCPVPFTQSRPSMRRGEKIPCPGAVCIAVTMMIGEIRRPGAVYTVLSHHDDWGRKNTLPGGCALSHHDVRGENLSRAY
ncbi:hypothetical protein AVEN_181720-1 [Araneus ventricosus]|uniref:Uncharacterized protein n=1 Tax=Araneus ventricosus TaxID=182803 RepID=A0A4Y2EC52_ARAVE|nr:hypothetical protein AVEN_181720-1 [Araneus ventricosus]